MKARREFRGRDETEVDVLDALVDRNSEGMTVFEIRSHVEADIDELEGALSELKEDGLISVEENDQRTVIKPDERVVPDPGDPDPEDESFVDRVRGFLRGIRGKLPF